jgi:hypothetical protein
MEKGCFRQSADSWLLFLQFAISLSYGFPVVHLGENQLSDLVNGPNIWTSETLASGETTDERTGFDLNPQLI